METVVKLSCNLKGLKRSKSWRKNLSGFFELDNGTPLSDSQVRRIVEYGIKNGYETERDIPGEEIEKLLKDNNIKEESKQLELFQ